MNAWLFKSEPQVFGIEHLQQAGNSGTCWDGVRNYQARNYLRDNVKVDDRVFIYHSSCQQVGIAGIARVTRDAYPDPTQFDPSSPYYDAKATSHHPRWYSVDVVFEKKINPVLPLSVIKQLPGLEALPLVRKGHRLSIMPVSSDEWSILMAAVQCSQ